MMQDYPGRFGMFAAIPLPDIEGSLREIEYALDVLKLDGIGLMTNYGETWPGNPAFDAVFDELNRRKSIVYFHPTAPTCCPNVPGLGAPLIEYPTDTTRCITNLLFTGTLSRCPDLRFIFSHGGGTLPMVLSRILGVLQRPILKEVAARIPQGAMHEFAKLYYDTTSVTNRPVLAALKEFVPMTQLLFGTDYPYWGIGANAEGLQELGLSVEVLRMIERENALRLFPRFA
jgi:6-methylsalicylate decarboxylase